MSLCIRRFSILSSHSFHKYCFSTHYMPGRESSSSLQPWTRNQFSVMGSAPGTCYCVPAKPHLEELWANVNIWAEKRRKCRRDLLCLRSEAHVRCNSGKRQYEGVCTGGGCSWVGQGNTEMMTWEVREGFQGRSWGETNKNVPYFTMLSRILVPIRVLGKNAGKFAAV